MPKTLPAMLANLFLVGVVMLIFIYYGEMTFWSASLLATGVWLATMLIFKLILRWGGVKEVPESPWASLNLDEHFHRVRLQELFDQYGVKGSMNVRDGHIFPVVNSDLLSPLAKRLRGAVAMVKRHPRAGADLYYMEDSILGMADLTIMEVEQAASVIEREVEDRNSSRKLYRGFGDAEVVGMARTVVADYLRNAPDGDSSDTLVYSNAVRRGECDEHPMMDIAIRTVRFILQIKGTSI